MPLPEDRLQQIINAKDVGNAVHDESWSIIDGALVIFDLDGPPAWLVPILAARDDNGDTPFGLHCPPRASTDSITFAGSIGFAGSI